MTNLNLKVRLQEASWKAILLMILCTLSLRHQSLAADGGLGLSAETTAISNTLSPEATFNDNALAIQALQPLWIPGVGIFMAFTILYSLQRKRINSFDRVRVTLQGQLIEQQEEVTRQRLYFEAQSKELHTTIEKSLEKEGEIVKLREKSNLTEIAKNNLISTLSYGIRTPLNGLVGTASLLLHSELSGEQQEFVTTIRKCSENILTTLHDINEFSIIESGHFELTNEIFNLEECLEEVLDLFSARAHETDFDFLYEIASDVPKVVSADSTRLKMVLTNLIGTSIKFADEKDHILVSVQVLEKTNQTVSLGFKVQDTGIGIPYESGIQMFKVPPQIDYSITNKFGGTGLGFSACQNIVSAMGGSIAMESSRGKGTVFSFQICARQSEVPGTTFNPSFLIGKKILVVDNNAKQGELLRNQLLRWNAIPIVASSALSALQAVTRNPDIAVILADFRMPELDGVAIARSTRKSNPAIPVIVVGSPQPKEAESFGSLFVSAIPKPIKTSVLYNHLVAAISSNVPIDELAVNADHIPNNFADLHPMRILIADDNQINRRMTEKVLNKLGYTPQLVTNGIEVLAAIDNKSFGMILMDVQMPEMDGLEATTRIRRKKEIKQPVIVAMTALAMKGDREECLRAGMDDYISKPIKPEDLIAILEKWSQRSSKTVPVGYFRKQHTSISRSSINL